MPSSSSYTTWKEEKKKNPSMGLHDNLALENYHVQFSLDNREINVCIARRGNCCAFC